MVKFDYSYLWTPWLLGPLSVALFFVLGTILWQIWIRIKRRSQNTVLEDQKRRLAESFSKRNLAVVESGESIESGPEMKSPVFSRPKEFTISIQFKNLGLILRNGGQSVLKGVTGEIKAGRMTAVMGPSGSGKTTFMSTIAGEATYGKMTGKVLINGQGNLPIRKFKNITGFVPQEDVMHREMTVYETLLFAAMTRLPRFISPEQKKLIVEDVIQLLDLDAIRFSQIGDENVRGISGGQRKRVNIGMELVADPTLLFLDEPTSGLDSSSSMSICNALRKISGLGITIVSVIHQPRYEIFKMFHDVLILAKGGQTVYLGPTESALEYFESIGYQCPNHANPSDFFIDIVSGAQAKEDGTYLTTDELVFAWKRRESQLYQISTQEENGSASDSDPENPDVINLTDEPGFDSGVNPIGLSDVITFLKKMYFAGKRTLKRNVPVLEMSREELFPIDEKDDPFAPKKLEGGRKTFITWYIICFLIFLLTPLAVFPICHRAPSLAQQYGGILGLLSVLVVFYTYFGFVFLLYAPRGLAGVGWAGVIFYCIIPATCLFILIIILIKRYREGKEIPYIQEVIGASFGWLVYVYVAWNKYQVSVAKRMAILLGFVVTGWVLFGLTAGIIISPQGEEDSFKFLPYWPETLGFVLFYGFITFMLARRMHILPLNDRPNASIYRQTWYVTMRGFIQISRSWLVSSFDLLLVINAGVFVGIMYYQQYYEGPVIDQLPNQTCPDGLPSTACTFLSLPQKDPLSGQASMTCLALALAAVASSMRVFGDEHVTFRRESRAGLRTEAYYIGKTISRFPTEVLAPLMFTLCYYAIILPISPFYQYMFLYFLIYWSCSGLAFFVSLVTPPALSQLAGVLTVLTFMMFSGAAPTLIQLENNMLLPYVLWAVSWVSLFRYTQELYYLIGITPYDPSPSTATLVYYGYNLDDKILCWLMIFGLGIVFRFMAYVALVVREKRQ